MRMGLNRMNPVPIRKRLQAKRMKANSVSQVVSVPSKSLRMIFLMCGKGVWSVGRMERSRAWGASFDEIDDQ